MKIIKKVIGFLAKPTIVFLLITTLVAIVGIIVGAIFLVPSGVAGYDYLGYSFLTVGGILGLYSLIVILRNKEYLKERALKWSEKHKFWNKLFQNYNFRTIIFSIGAFAINIAFALYNGAIAIGIILRPDVSSLDAIWFGALSAYHLLLIALRGGILLYHRKKLKKQSDEEQAQKQFRLLDNKTYGVCGILLLLLPLALSFAIMQMVSADYAFVHSGLTIYIYAIYAFYKIIASVYNFVKANKNDEMTVKALRNISLADAMVSVLALQTAMFREFHQNGSELNSALMNGVTGAVVCALTVAIGIFMIVNAIIKIKKIKQENGDEQQRGI